MFFKNAKNNKSLNIRRILFFCIILIITIVPLLHFSQFSVKPIILSTFNYFVKDPANLSNNFFTWHSGKFGDSNVGSLWRLFPLNTIYFACDNFFGITPSIVQFFIFLFLFLIGFVSFYVLMRELFNSQKINKTAAFIGALFFIYNLYVITYLSESYLLIMPYVFLPLQFYLFIKGMRSNKLLKYGILLGLVNLLVFGVNLIFNVIVAFLLLSYGLWSVFILKEVKFKKIIKLSALAGVLTLLFIVWWLALMLYGSIIDQSTTQSVLGSESFYNNDTSAVNIFRNLGSWGFFSGHGGIPYKSFSPAYKDNPIVVFGSFALPIIIFLPLFLFRKIRDRKYKKKILFFYISIIALFPFIGGIYKTWPTRDLMQWLFDNVPYFMAFRNTYKWTSITVFFYAILIVLFLNYFFNIRKKKNHKTIFPLKYSLSLLVFIIIMINAFPIWTGGLFGEGKQIEKIPAYWNQMAGYVNGKLDTTQNRILLLPDQYFTVFLWDNQMVSLRGSLADILFETPITRNACAGCGNYHTSQLYSFIYDNLKTQNLDKLLGMVNISHLLQRNDFYSEYYRVEKPREIREIISLYPSISSVANFGMLNLYKLRDNLVYPRIYSPSKAVITDTFSEALDIFDRFNSDGEKLSFILSSQINSNSLTLENSNYYKKLFKKENTEFENNKATEEFEIPMEALYEIAKDKNYIFNTYQIYYIHYGGSYILRLKNIDEKVSVVDKQIDSDIADGFEKKINLGVQTSDPVGVEIGGKMFYLEPVNDWQYLDSIQLEPKDSYNISVYETKKDDSDNLVENGSFEYGFWNKKVGNCNLRNLNAKLSMDLVEDASDRRLSLLLSAEEDSACSYSQPIANFEPDAVYLLSFDYKNIEGSAPSFCAYDGNGCALYSDTPISKDWQTYRTFVRLDSEARQFILYFYSHKSGIPKTANLYDNVKIYKIMEAVKEIDFNLPNPSGFSEDISLGDKSYQAVAEVFQDELNLLENGSFEDGFWNEKVGNCRLSDPNAPLDMKLVDDFVDGEVSLELSAQSDVACVSSPPVIKFSRDKTYAISFDYKIVEGDLAKFCLWDGKSCVKIENLEKTDNDWHHYEGIIEPNVSSGFLSVYFYASVENVKNAVVRYDNVKINAIENKILNSYELKTKNERNLDLAEIVFEKVNPTYYKLSVEQKDTALIIFQESFHPGWRAYIQNGESPIGFWQNAKRYLGFWDEKEVSRDRHIIANGFANAWWVMPEDFEGKESYEIILEFWPQRLFYFMLLISCVALLGSVGYLGWVWRRGRRNKK